MAVHFDVWKTFPEGMSSQGSGVVQIKDGQTEWWTVKEWAGGEGRNESQQLLTERLCF